MKGDRLREPAAELTVICHLLFTQEDTPTPCRLTRRHFITISHQHNNNSQFRNMYWFVFIALLSINTPSIVSQ